MHAPVPSGRRRLRNGRGRLWLLLCGLLMVLSTSSARAQGTIDKRFALKVQPKFGVTRGHAPVALSVALQWSAAELMEGHLQLEWFVDSTLPGRNAVRLGRYVSHELALSDSSILLTVMLPPVMLPADDAIFSVEGKFITVDGKVYDLDVHDVALQPDWRRILVVGVCTKPGSAIGSPRLQQVAGPGNPLARGFRLEPFFAERFTKRELLVDDTEVDPADMPSDPLQYTAFDLFVLPADSLAKLKERQLEALLSWVRAGGSVCVFVDSAMPSSHVEWLNRLVGRDITDAAFLRGADGHVIPADDELAGLTQHPVDYGRVVTILGDPKLPEKQWQQAVLFLWKVRRDRIAAVDDGERWRVRLSEMTHSYLPSSRLGPQRIWDQSALKELLKPDSVRGLPLASVGLVLAVFLLVIAPGDYYLLGWLKRRRWTWILFPAMSLLFTGYIMWMARQHLGETSYVHAITVVDLGRDGEPVRTSRFEMIFAASNRTATDDLQGKLMMPPDPNMERILNQIAVSGSLTEYEQPWTFSGRIPQNYSVRRDIQQWSQRMARITNFGPGEVPLPATSPRELVVQPSGIPGVTLRRGEGIPEAIVRLAENITVRSPPPEHMDNRSASPYFTVVSQLSPTGGGNWEDLALLDASNPHQSVMVDVTSPAEGEYVITRRLQWESN